MTPVSINFAFVGDGFFIVPNHAKPDDLLEELSDRIKGRSLDWDYYSVEAKCYYCGCFVELEEIDGYECPCQDISGPRETEDEAYERKRQEVLDYGD